MYFSLFQGTVSKDKCKVENFIFLPFGGKNFMFHDWMYQKAFLMLDNGVSLDRKYPGTPGKEDMGWKRTEDETDRYVEKKAFSSEKT